MRATIYCGSGFAVRLLAIAALVSIAAGCASKGPKADSSGGQQQASAPAKPEEEGEGGTAGSTVDAPTSRSRSLDPKYSGLAQALRSGSKPSVVQDEVTKLLGANANDPVALNALALMHYRQGRTGSAKLLLARAFEKNPQNASLHNNLGVILLAEGDQAAAIVEFKKALKIDDRNAEALGNLGSIYMQAGDYSRALPPLEASYKLNRSNVAVANNYAMALRANKDYAAAQKIYEDVIQQSSKEVATILNYAILLIDYMNKPKEGLDLVYRVKFLETERKDVLARANALEKKAKSELK